MLTIFLVFVAVIAALITGAGIAFVLMGRGDEALFALEHSLMQEAEQRKANIKY